MKIVLVIVCYLLSAININLSDVRKLYIQVHNSIDKQHEFVALLQNVNDSTVELKAYKAVARIIESKSLKGKQRTDLFRQATQMLDKAVEEDSTNLEVRLIRLSVQEHLPKFLNYNKSINDDVQFINANLKKVKDKELRDYINQYMSQSKQFKQLQK
ncbi:MAG: hypothetical protein Q4B43_00460 [Bacteroidota bacterium]|nr:hypothetical protein [Bacteroidota bacterium]